jgi:DNA (cytosine-5)-methyltransferase 1
VRPRLLDLFCGAGGAAWGYHCAGFEVVGVDVVDQPNYPFCFVRADALATLARLLSGGALCECLDDYALKDFDAIHASPPCQAYSAGGSIPGAGEHVALVELVRDLLDRSGLPYVIENVVGAPLRNAVILCGAAFGLRADGHDLARHRLFETNWQMGLVPPCAHGSSPVIGIYGDRAKASRGETLTVRSSRWSRPRGLAVGGEAMGIDWMTWRELSQAIPPAYAEHVGGYLMREVVARAAREDVAA